MDAQVVQFWQKIAQSRDSLRYNNTELALKARVSVDFVRKYLSRRGTVENAKSLPYSNFVIGLSFALRINPLWALGLEDEKPWRYDLPKGQSFPNVSSMSFGKRLREIMKRSGTTYDALSLKSELPRELIDHWTIPGRFANLPGPFQVLKAARALDAHFMWLCCGLGPLPKCFRGDYVERAPDPKAGQQSRLNFLMRYAVSFDNSRLKLKGD